MKKTLIFTLCLLLASCLAGCRPTDAMPSSTSIRWNMPDDGPADSSAATPTPDLVQVLAQRPPFTTGDTLAGLELQITRIDANQILGAPREQIDDSSAQAEYWNYDDILLRFDRNEAGDKLLSVITVFSPDIELLRGLHIGDDVQTVMNAFYRDLALADELVDGATVLYKNAQGGDVLLPPRGVITHVLEDPGYDQVVEYACPAQPYESELLSDSISAYMDLPHHILRFYFSLGALVSVELRFAAFTPKEIITETPILPPSSPELSPSPTPGVRSGGVPAGTAGLPDSPSE